MQKKAKILIADDDQSVRKLVGQILNGEGYEVISVSDGQQAINKIENEKPDLIVSDIYMPGVNGKEITKRIKSDNKTRLIPVIILTGATKTQDKIDAIESGADEFVNKPLKPIEFITRVKSLLKMKFLNDELDSAEHVVFALARAIEAKDEYTQGHTERVSLLAQKFGELLAINEEELSALYKGGILHDVGKIGIPDSILNKPGKLTEEEFALIREHPVKGEKICAGLNSIKKTLPVIRHHHEKYNGTGYPDKLSGEKIPLLARIMAIVDVFDALVTKRAYRDKMPSDAALNIMQEETEKGFWDKKLFYEFKKIVNL